MQSVCDFVSDSITGKKYIEEFLISLQGQTFQNYICYIHDDGSKDRTREGSRKNLRSGILGTSRSWRDPAQARGEGELSVDAWADRGGILYVCGSG